MPPIHAATACLPGVRYEDAAAVIACGVSEPALGRLQTAHIQLCPQNFGVMDVSLAESLRDSYPDTQFRLHANLRVPLYGNPRWDASHFSADRRGYYEAMAEASRTLGAPAYSLHAGYRSECELPKLRGNVLAIQDIFGVPVALEGMYPARNDPYLVSAIEEYEWLLDSGLYFALDLSHLAIVAHRARVEPLDLAAEMACHPRCIEIHVSDNGGRGDQHEVLSRHPWWWPVLERAALENPDVAVFSEGNQLRGLDRDGRELLNWWQRRMPRFRHTNYSCEEPAMSGNPNTGLTDHRDALNNLWSDLNRAPTPAPSVEYARNLLDVLAPLRHTILEMVGEILKVAVPGCRRLVICGESEATVEGHHLPFVVGIEITDRDGVEYFLGADADLPDSVVAAVRDQPGKLGVPGNGTMSADIALSWFAEQLDCEEIDSFLLLLEELAPIVVKEGDVVFIDHTE